MYSSNNYSFLFKDYILVITIISNNPRTCSSCRENMYLDEAGWHRNAPRWAPEPGSVPVSVS